MYEKGLVSIIMPSYNTAAFIGESIESVLKQTYTEWELLIVDDCSTDNTEEIVKQYDDDRIKFFKQEKNSGAASCRNYALRMARGEWAAFLDSDDLWTVDKLEKQLSFMIDNNYKFSSTGRDEISETSEPLKRVTVSPHHITKTGMYLYCWVGCLAVMYHIPTVGVLQIENLKKNNDYAMWLKVIKKTDCYCLDDVLAHYRVRKQSISHDKFKKLLMSHYLLFRKGENMSVPSACALTAVNCVFGMIKKIFFVRRR